MHSLGESLVGPGEQHEELSLGSEEVLLSGSVERAVVVDRMDNRPGKRKERHPVAFEVKRIIAAQRDAVFFFKAREKYPRAQFNDLIHAGVHDAKFEGSDSMIRSNHGHIAEHDPGYRTREARENKAGCECESQQTGY